MSGRHRKTVQPSRLTRWSVDWDGAFAYGVVIFVMASASFGVFGTAAMVAGWTP
jgi:hypothetical protein